MQSHFSEPTAAQRSRMVYEISIGQYEELTQTLDGAEFSKAVKTMEAFWDKKYSEFCAETAPELWHDIDAFFAWNDRRLRKSR